MIEKSKKHIIVLVTLEGKESYTEINFLEGLVDSIKHKYKKTIFVSPISINGDSKNKNNFVNAFFSKLESGIEFTTSEKFNIHDNVYVFCIWDTPKKQTNLKDNYNLLVKDIRSKNNKYDYLSFAKGIEMGLFAHFFSDKVLSLKQLVKKMNYKTKKDFKIKSNKHLFYNIMKKAEIDTNDTLVNMKKRLEENKENNLIKILNLVLNLNK